MRHAWGAVKVRRAAAPSRGDGGTRPALPDLRVDDERGRWEQMGDEASRDVPGAGAAAVTIEEWGDFQ